MKNRLMQILCQSAITFVIITLLCVSYNHQVNCDLVILNLNDASKETREQICAIRKEPALSDYGITYPLLDATPYTGCFPIVNETFRNKSVVLRFADSPTSRCPLSQILSNLELNQARLAIIGSNGPIRINLTNSSVHISPIFMPAQYSDQLNSFMLKTPQSSVILSSTREKFDFSLLIIWLIATVAVFLGSLWSNLEYKKSLSKACSLNRPSEMRDPLSAPAASNDAEEQQQQQETDKKKSSNTEDSPLLHVNFIGILILLVFVVGILLLLYFFYKYMIYFVYAIFLLGATMSMYRIVCLFFDKLNVLRCRIPENRLPLLKHQPEISKIIISLLLIGVSVVWFVFRNESWAWALQNVLALSLAINALSFYRLSSYKMVTVILVLFFLYDVFMVYITPFITKGTSIMEAVAFGGRDSGSKEVKNEINFNITSTDTNRLPVVIVVPRLSKITKLCSYYLDYPFSLLGLGDLLIPGLSVNYAILFDTASRNRVKVYFIVNMIAYGVGLFLAFIGLVFMKTAQPALFYLCPVHLIFTYSVALARKEVKSLWSGESIGRYSVSSTAEDTKSFRSDSLENIIDNEQAAQTNANETPTTNLRVVNENTAVNN